MLISYNSIYPVIIQFKHVLRHVLPLAEDPDDHQFTSTCQKPQGKCWLWIYLPVSFTASNVIRVFDSSTL